MRNNSKAALTLLQNGVPVRIIAKEQSHRPGQRGSGVSARTLEVYNFLGVKEVSEKAAFCFDMLEHAKGSSKVHNVARMAAWTEPSPSCPWRTMLLMGQNSAEEILRSHLAKFGCEVELGTTLSSFQQDSEHVTAVLVKTVDDKETTESIEVDWLVGADGARGVTRKALGLTFLGETHENENMVTGDVTVEGLSTLGWHNFGDRSSAILTLKPSEKLDSSRQFFIMGPNVDHAKLSSDRTALYDFFAEYSGLPREAFGEIAWVTDYRPNFRVVNKFGEGRAFVVGDAAHVHSPQGGQGMNSSVQDSFNLAWKLALVAKKHASSSLLETYTAERLPVIVEMLNISKSLQKLVSDPTAKNVWERDGKLMQLGVNYRGSTIVVDETEGGAGGAEGNSYNVDGALRGGDRAPDAPGLSDLRSLDGAKGVANTRLFDIFKPYKHTVLVFSSAAPTEQCTAILRALERYPKDLIQSVVVHSWQVYKGDDAGLETATMVLRDKLGHAYDGYAVIPRAEAPTVYIIRPDGVIGGLVHGVEGVDKYFGGIFL
ncbi:hypothetical protein HWV62_28549 [Athelia sp. TMB]|nr:hypothetical protein HWV62_28549 [Athelia sp. TMB]